ncbi:hypothetical protein G6514_001672 [Epicoccum nigrum]|nr:hypothetical protein G6514_001672 [Epicoccum nigrum]
MDPTDAHNQTQSPLCRLPAEIRNRIYELVLGGRTFVVLPSPNPPFNLKLRQVLDDNRLQRRRREALSLTCILIHRETRNTLLFSNTFILSTNELQQAHSRSPLLRHVTVAIIHIYPDNRVVAAGLPDPDSDPFTPSVRDLVENYPLDRLERIRVLFFAEPLDFHWTPAERARILTRLWRCFLQLRGGRAVRVAGESDPQVFVWELAG